MKHILLLAFGLVVWAGGARADEFRLATDIHFYECALVNLAPFPERNTLYVFQQYNGGSTASQFKVDDTSGLVFFSATSPYLLLGAWNTDMSIAYGGCVVGSHVVLTLEFLWFGVPITGCDNRLVVVPAPTSPLPGEIAIVGCGGPPWTLRTGWGRPTFVGADAITCDLVGSCCSCVVPVHQATWGSVKALYR
jgi:hypothetical protein